MHPAQLVDPLLTGRDITQLISGWDEAVFARLVAAVLSVVLLALGVFGLRRGRNAMVHLVQLLLGAAVAIFAVWPQATVTAAIQVDYAVRIRVIALGLSVTVLIITVEAIRRGRLSERYALLWLVTAAVMLLSALYPKLVALLRACTGMTYATALFCVLFGFMMLVLFHFSIALSMARADQTRLTQRLAIVEARLRELEARTAAPTSPREGTTPGA